MASYDFYCDSCDDQRTVELPINGIHEVTCHCQNSMRKIYSPVPIHLRGTGWGSK